MGSPKVYKYQNCVGIDYHPFILLYFLVCSRWSSALVLIVGPNRLSSMASASQAAMLVLPLGLSMKKRQQKCLRQLLNHRVSHHSSHLLLQKRLQVCDNFWNYNAQGLTCI